METDDVVMFCQSELPYNSFIAFEEMRKKEQFCDLTIKMQNHSFTAHRMILAAAIPYFNSLYANNTVDTDERELSDVDIDPGALESLLHFAYTGKVSITMENVNSLLVASHFLKLNQVFDSCVGFISKRLSTGIVLNVRTLASGLDNLKLIENCDLYIRNNFEEFSKCADFLNMPHSCFKEIIAKDDLIVSSEEVVFDAVMKWTKASPSERHVSLSELLNEVRLIYLPLDYFVDRVECEKLISSSEACRVLIQDVKSYHLLPERRSALSNLKKRPRNFLGEELVAFCSSGTSGYSLYHLVNETWIPCESKKFQCKDKIMHVVRINDKIYIFLKETIVTFCITTSEWEKLTTMHKSIRGAAVVPYEDKIYCFGSENLFLNTKLRCFDTKLNQWLQEVGIKSQKCYSAGASLKDSIYLTGGGNNLWQKFNTVEKYNPSTCQFSDIAPMLTERDNHACTSLNEKIYVCGGLEVFTALNTSEVYDPITNQWNDISSMAKYSFTLISHHNRLYALQDDSDFEIYDPKRNEWKCCLKPPKGFADAIFLPSSCLY